MIGRIANRDFKTAGYWANMRTRSFRRGTDDLPVDE
jgi:hypothetical protein